MLEPSLWTFNSMADADPNKARAPTTPVVHLIFWKAVCIELK